MEPFCTQHAASNHICATFLFGFELELSLQNEMGVSRLWPRGVQVCGKRVIDERYRNKQALGVLEMSFSACQTHNLTKLTVRGF
jgi:hypothetical protein